MFMVHVSWETDPQRVNMIFTQKMVFKGQFVSATGDASTHSLFRRQSFDELI